MKLSKLDQSIAEFYAPALLSPIKYGENGVFFWFPASGMTTINRDVFNDKGILTRKLQGFAKRINILHFWGDLGERKSLKGILNESGFKDFSELKKACEKTLQKGNEVVCVIGGIDDFPKEEKLSVLKTFVRLNAINHRRIHIILNLQDKPSFEEMLKTNSEVLVLANNIKIMPVLNNDLLSSYIKQKSSEYGWSLTKSDTKHINSTYGGILQLTKEFLRSKGEISTLELKLRIIWNRLPKTYQDFLSDSVKSKSNTAFKDLKDFGILELEVFDLHRSALNINPSKILPKLLTNQELELWKYCTRHMGKMIDKDTIIEILRPGSNEDISMWALDQAASRFRKKLSKAGIDPEIFKTIKGKGYQWN